MPTVSMQSSRRRFIHAGGGLVATSSLAPIASAAERSPAGGWFAGGSATIRVGLVGCGGRGIGAALQALAADPAVQIVAISDLFADRVTQAAESIARATAGRHGKQPAAPRQFIGGDARAGVLAAGVDLVLLATPPARRPEELEAAVAAGCHIYCEAPVAVDATGCQRAAGALAEARLRGLVVASGLAFRHDAPTAAVIERIHAGAIGTPRSVMVVAEAGLPWRVSHRPGMSAIEWRERNWISFSALGGGAIVERQIHPLDKVLWALGDELPLSATGRVLPSRVNRSTIGDVTDGLSVRYHFAGGARVHVLCRRDGTGEECADETVHGSAGFADLRSGVVAGRAGGADPAASIGPCGADGSRYQASMSCLVRAIRTGTALDEGPRLVRATGVALLGREAARLGRSVGFADVGLPTDGTNRPFDTAVTIGQAVNMS